LMHDSLLNRWIVNDGTIRVHTVDTLEQLFVIDSSQLEPIRGKARKKTQTICDLSLPCIDHLGRWYLVDKHSNLLCVFSAHGDPITFCEIDGHMFKVVFDTNRGDLMILHIQNRMTRIAANSLVPNMYVWTPSKHRYAPPAVECVVGATCSANTLATDSMVSVLSNEVLFSVFLAL